MNAVLRRAARESLVTDECLSTPEWLRERWRAQYGAEQAEAIARASLARPLRYIRVPPARNRRPGRRRRMCLGCFTLETGEAGSFRFQDIGSQAVVPLLELAHRGRRSSMSCAAPGNKTAQALESGVRAIACDLHLSRAKTLLPLGIPIAVVNAEVRLPFARKFDRVLVDAPCSGTGTLARNPEIKWRLSEADIGDLQRRQIAILRNALELVAAGRPAGVFDVLARARGKRRRGSQRPERKIERTMQRIPGRDAGRRIFRRRTATVNSRVKSCQA